MFLSYCNTCIFVSNGLKKYFYFRKVKVTYTDISHLKSMTSSPISYLVSTPKKMKTTHLGEVPIASGLSTHMRVHCMKHDNIYCNILFMFYI